MDKNRRQELALEYLKNQIEELYGPLFGLIQQSKISHDFLVTLLPTNSQGNIDRNSFSDNDSEIWNFFTETYFLPINKQIRELIRTKVYLLENGTMPSSFIEFFQHEVNLESRHLMWKEMEIDTANLHGVLWPSRFNNDVEETLERLLTEYQHYKQNITSA
jgi:hypothetical protein